jgi:oligopeptide transport system permease protein
MTDDNLVTAPPEPAAPAAAVYAKPRSLGADAWDEMRHRPLFWIAAALVALMIVMAAAPELFAPLRPGLMTGCPLAESRLPPRAGHILGSDYQGCDIYTRVIHGARSSVLVGVMTALFAALVGGVLGTIAGYAGGAVDAVLSRVADIFYSIPMLLGAIVLMTSIRTTAESPYLLVLFKVVLAMGLFGWPNIFRLMRAAVIQTKPSEYVQAARALGASPWRAIRSHIVPNSLTPVIVVSTIDLGTYIVTEATLSYLGVGLQKPAISWGVDISAASPLGFIRTTPHMLLFPAAALFLTVLAFIMLGEVVRDALDPKLR